MMVSMHARTYAPLVAGCLAAASAAFAFEWPVKPCDEVRADMIGFAQSLRDSTTNTHLHAELAAFVAQQEAAASDGPAAYAWMGQAEAFVRERLLEFPPAPENTEVRKGVLRILDYPLHVNNDPAGISAEGFVAYNKMVADYFGAAKRRVFRELESAKPEEGVIIWKLYNMGFIVRSPTRTLAIDISANPVTRLLPEGQPPTYTGDDREAFTDAEYDRLVNQLDAIFITHLHTDHLSGALLGKMLAAGKPVVVPAAFGAPAQREEHLASDSNPSGKMIVLDTSHEEPLAIAGVKVRSFAGNQGANTPCNIYHLDLDGTVIVHNGDNYDRTQEARLANCPPANIIIASCWNNMTSWVSNAMAAARFGESRAILIPAHENELMHGVGNRESYRELYTRADRLGSSSFAFPPAFVLDCGESLTYPALQSLPIRPAGP